MNKFLVSALTAAALLSATAPVVHAAAVTGAFSATVTLTAQCIATNATTPVLAFGTYLAFTNATINATISTPLTFKCTNGLPAPTVAFDVGGAGGVLAGLAYTLTTPVLTRSGGSAGSTSVAATEETYSYTFGGSIATGQSGTCATAAPCSASASRTIVVTY